MYFGSDELLAGQTIGAEAHREDGGGKTLCIIQAQGSVALETRCQGVKQGFANTENLQVNGADLPSVQQTIQSKLAAGPVDHQHRDAGCADRAGRDAGPGGGEQHRAKLATFDLNQEAAQAIKDGKILFSVDQQPYVQGYMAVDVAVAEPDQRQRHRRRQAGADRPVDRRHHQHRPDPALHRQQQALATSSGGAAPRRACGAAPPGPATPPWSRHELSCYDADHAAAEGARRARARQASRCSRVC